MLFYVQRKGHRGWEDLGPGRDEESAKKHLLESARNDRAGMFRVVKAGKGKSVVVSGPLLGDRILVWYGR